MLNNIKSFGFNVIPENRQKTAEAAVNTVESAISGLWEPILGYLKENENVFSGEVMTEIDKISNQTILLGMTLNQDAPKTTINFES